MANPGYTDGVLEEAARLYKQHGNNVSVAARAAGVARPTFQHRIEEAKRRGLLDDNLQLFGTSTLRNADGEVILEWEKRKADSEQIRAALEETVKAFTEPLKGLAKPTKAPKATLSDIKTEYILTDLHLGMYAWGEEAGEDYDVEIATRLAASAVDRLVESCPASETCILNQMGDFLHADSNTPMTPRGGNILDIDTRHRKVVRAGVQLARYAVEKLLEKHKTVEVRNTPGNHDTHSSIILDEALIAYYEKEKRVIVHDSPRPFWAYRFGSNLVGIGHGHAPKPAKMPGLLAADYPEWWGETEFKYCRHGHLHHERGFTDMGVRCEGFPTLAAKDAWHTGEGYRSGRRMVAIVLHKKDGEIERHTASLRRLEA